MSGPGGLQARMSGMSLPPGMTPDMMKQASQMFSQMSPEDLDRIMAHAGSAGPPLAPSSMPAPGSGPGSPPGPGPSVSSMPAPGAGSTQAAAALSPGAGQFQGAAAMLQVGPIYADRHSPLTDGHAVGLALM